MTTPPAEALLATITGATADPGFGPTAVDVPTASWHAAVACARDEVGLTFFDFLSAVDLPQGIRVTCHLASPPPVRHLLLRTLLVEDNPVVETIADLYAGAAWHERETAEMFGVAFVDGAGEPVDRPGLLLPDGFDGHPLRKDFLLASRLDRPWPGSKEPGESDEDASPSRRRMRPPGVPEDHVPGDPS